MQFLAKRTPEAGSLQQEEETYGRHHIGYQCFFRAHEVQSKWEVPSRLGDGVGEVLGSPNLDQISGKDTAYTVLSPGQDLLSMIRKKQDHCSVMKSPPGKDGHRTCVQPSSSCFHAGGWLP